jgi:hypothetical protein
MTTNHRIRAIAALAAAVVALVLLPATASALPVNLFSNNNGTTAAPEPINFGTRAAGNPNDITVWVRNTNTANTTAASITGISVTGSGFTRNGGTCTSTSPFTMNASTAGSTTTSSTQNCTVIIRMGGAGTTPGAKTGTITVTSSTAGSGSPITRQLTGTVEADAPAAQVRDTAGTTAKPSHDYGTIVATTTSPYTFTIVNTGNVAVTNPNVQAITGANAAEFTRTSTTCTATLAVGASCNVVVTFAPTTAGAKTAQLDVTTGNAGTLTTTLTGAATAPNPVATLQDTPGTSVKTAHEFGSVVQGVTSSYTWTLRNTGDAPLAGLTAGTTLSGDTADFTLSRTCGDTLAAGATCTITTTFAPSTSTAPGAKAATLTVDASNAEATTGALTGTSIQAVPGGEIRDTGGSSAKSQHDFGNVTIGGTAASYVFTLRNTGNTTLTGANTQSVTGANAAEFARTTTCAATVPVNGSCTITITFNPAAPGARTAQLNVTTNAGTLTAALTGTGKGLVVRNNDTLNLTGVTQRRWLESATVGGRAPKADRLRFAFDVETENGAEVEDVLISSTSTTSDTAPVDSTFSPIPPGIGRVAVSTPPGGSNRAFVEAEMPLSNISGWDTGIGDGLLCLFATNRTSNRRVWVRFRDSNGVLSPKYGSIVRVTDATFACSPPPVIFDQRITAVGGEAPASQAVVTTPGTPVEFTFKGDNQNSSGDPLTVTGVNWRIRNARTGAMFTRTPAGVGDLRGAVHRGLGLHRRQRQPHRLPDLDPGGRPHAHRRVPLARPVDRRGGAPRAEPGPRAVRLHRRRLGQLAAGRQPDDLADRHPAGPPGDGLGLHHHGERRRSVRPVEHVRRAGRPADDRRVGPRQRSGQRPRGDGFEDRVVGDPDSGLPAAALERAFSTAGKEPGPYTVRVRVTDNGSHNGSDPARASKVATSSFTINAPPVPDDQTVDVESDDPQPAEIALTATDADGDPLTFDVPAAATTGSLSNGNGPDREYTWPTTWTAPTPSRSPPRTTRTAAAARRSPSGCARTRRSTTPSPTARRARRTPRSRSRRRRRRSTASSAG